MFKLSRFPLAAVALTVTATSVLAQSAGPLNNLPEIVISPTGFATPAAQVASSVTVITEEQIQRDGIRTVPDLLRTVPGLNVVQTGIGITSVFIRGTNSNHVKVIVDGIDVSDPTNPTRQFDFGPLTTADIERIEILRGPQSGLYGADAIGGVISITTKRGNGPAKVRAMIEGGSFGTFNKAAQISGGTQNYHYAFTISNFLSASTPTLPDRLVPPGGTRRGDYSNNYTYTTKFGFNPTENLEFNFVGRFTEQKFRYYNFDFATQDEAHSYYFYGLTEATYKAWDGRFNNTVGFGYTDILRKTAAFDGFTPPGRFEGDRTKYYWKSDLAIMPGHKLLAGVERIEERALNAQFGAPVRGEHGNTGVYAEIQSSFGDRFFLVSNIRHDANDVFGDATTWRIAPAFLIHETDTKLKASYGTGFRAPAIAELYGFGGNPNLRPERSKGYDVGFEQWLLQKRIHFGAVYFENDIEDLVAGFPFVNIGLAETKGYEAFVAAQVTPTFQIRLDYTRIDAKDARTGLALLRRPENKYSFTTVWQATEKLDLSVASVWVSAYADGDRATFARIVQPGFNIWNIALNYKINPNLVAFGRIENLFDKQYEVPNGFEARGFGIFAGVRFAN